MDDRQPWALREMLRVLVNRLDVIQRRTEQLGVGEMPERVISIDVDERLERDHVIAAAGKLAEAVASSGLSRFDHIPEHDRRRVLGYGDRIWVASAYEITRQAYTFYVRGSWPLSDVHLEG